MTSGFNARQLWLSGLVAATIAIALIVASSGGDVDKMTFGDGPLYRAVAAELGADREHVPVALARSGTAIRYGRIGFPVLLWAASGGYETAMPYIQPLLMVLCAAAIGSAVTALVPKGGPVPPAALFVAVGLPASIVAGVAEPLAIALIIWSMVALTRRHPEWAAVLLAAAMLVRENAAAVVAALIVWELIGSRRRSALVLACSFVPITVWHLVVASRFGHLPLLDPYLRANGTDLAPVVGTWRALGRLSPSAVALLAVHLVAVLLAVIWWRRSRMAIVAAANGIALLFVGPLTWVYPGDAMRVASIFSTLFVLSLLVERFRSESEGAELHNGDRRLNGREVTSVYGTV